MGKYIKKLNPKKPGVKPREFDQAQFEKLCGLCATEKEIAGWFGCSIPTVWAWCLRTYGKNFKEIYEENSAGGKISLRRKQLELALNGSIPLLIWLGKQLLGQKEVVHTEAKVEIQDVDEAKLKEMPKDELIKTFFDELNAIKRQH